MLTPFGFKGQIHGREIEVATEEEFWELLCEEEPDIDEDADSHTKPNHGDSENSLK